jgi:membrane protein implicated in regulation of membrane protease activity
VLDLGLDLDVWPWVWLVIAVGFALVEITILGGSFILLPFAVSAFAASVLGFYDVSIEVQWAVFLFGGATLWLGFYRWARKFLDDHLLPPGVGAERLVGMTAIVTAEVDPDDTARMGRISVVGETWGAITHDEAALAEGTKVRITAMEGTRVVVEPVDTAGSNINETERDRP